MKFLKSLFTKPPIMAVVRAELDEAQRQYLAAQTAKEYATQMVVYHETRIQRLKKYIAENQPAA